MGPSALRLRMEESAKVNFTYVRLCKTNVGKIADLGLQFPFNFNLFCLAFIA